MRLAFWFQKFSRDELRRSPQAIANRGRWKNGDRQRSFRSAGVSWSPRDFGVRKFEACHHISSWAEGVPRVDL